MTDWLYFAGDFETTTVELEHGVRVWSSAVTQLYDDSDTVHIFTNIGDTLKFLRKTNRHIKIFYHNLKFDGSFIVNWLLKEGYRVGVEPETKKMKRIKNLFPEEFTVNITDRGQWYKISLYTGYKKKIEIIDSTKLLPFSLKKLGQAFETKHQKLDMDYNRHNTEEDIPITEEEKNYIENDVLVLKESLQVMFDLGHDRLTIGSCCLEEFKTIIGKWDFKNLFPDLTEWKAPEYTGCENADQYVRKSYNGGWCYVVPEKANKVFCDGLTLDVNSLYPSRMHSSSGCKYVYGFPIFGEGKAKPIEKRIFFQRFRCSFELKENKLPFIHVKDSFLYPKNENLVTSDYWSYTLGNYVHEIEKDGEKKVVTVELMLTQFELELFFDHYEVDNITWLDHCYFFVLDEPIFDNYINKYMFMKENAKNKVERTIAKLFLNNLYGKFGSSDLSSYKIPYLDHGVLKFTSVEEHEKQVGYVPNASLITSYARIYTISCAQKNYYGTDKKGFIYADTDSIHCDLALEDVKGFDIHPTKLGAFDCEMHWDKAIFVRQKTYIEIENGEYCIRCAGMTDKCKNLFIESVTQDHENTIANTDEELKFVNQKRTIKDFKVGLKIPSKLMQKQVKGGVLLIDTFYEMR